VDVGVLVVGEEVPHVHVHLVPFTQLSQMSFANQDTDPAPEALDQQAEALRTALRAAGFAASVPEG
jgi:histidine triad (HIT) family protein